MAIQSLFSAGDRQLHVVGEVPLTFDVCLLYYENREKNMRYCVLSPVVKETGACEENLVSMTQQNQEKNYLGTCILKGKIAL